MKKILLLTLVAVLAMLALASCAWIGGEEECAHIVTMPLGQGKAATCKEEGLTAGKKCADCGATIEEQQAIAKLEHTIEAIPAVEGSCTTKSSTAGEKCKVCGEVTIAPVEGDYKHSDPINVDKKEATCTKDGHEAGVKCGGCGAVISGMAKIDSKGGHTYDNSGKCTKCGAEINEGDNGGAIDKVYDEDI